MARYHASATSRFAEASVLLFRQRHTPHLGVADQEASMESTLAGCLFAAEMYAADLLVSQQKNVSDKHSNIRISGRTEHHIKPGN